ncbi:MAG: hypothetical protein DMD75_29680 [Candidatus Rokuibacteriota bacterium]|nr:MAG: hypothetical protein DMD75_29680 [Candidatus Rokubacteria bacterium]
MTSARPFRFGVFGETARSREALLGTARKAEDAGYSTFLIRDHFIEEPFGNQLAPLAALATVAGATKRLRVGSLVLSNDYRSRVQCPTLVLGGEEDPMTPIECQVDIAAALPAHLVRFERFAGCGHAVVPDAPERAMAVIRDFIAR